MATYVLEQQLGDQGFRFVVGLDEVGRGCLAGPVVAGAVCLDPKSIPKGIQDSKMLTALQRERLDKEIRERAVAYAIGVAAVEEIDRINILQASKLAMCRAIATLQVETDYLLIDGNFAIDSEIPQRAVVKGDQLSVSIAAASIVAKVFRDRMMAEFDQTYPGYLFAQNKGYGSEAHRKAIQEKGPTPLHRKSFSWTPV